MTCFYIFSNMYFVSCLLDAWAMPAKSQVYMLGQTINFQVSALNLSHGGKLFINHCYATTSKDSKTSLKFTVIDNFGYVRMENRDSFGLHLIRTWLGGI